MYDTVAYTKKTEYFGRARHLCPPIPLPKISKIPTTQNNFLQKSGPLHYNDLMRYPPPTTARRLTHTALSLTDSIIPGIAYLVAAFHNHADRQHHHMEPTTGRHRLRYLPERAMTLSGATAIHVAPGANAANLGLPVEADGAINGIPIGVDRYLPVGFMVVTGAAGWCIWDLRPQAGYRFPERRS